MMRVNPFATRYVAVADAPWVPAASSSVTSSSERGSDLTGLLDAFRERCGCRGAIVGAQGTGKTTLLRNLLQRLATERGVGSGPCPIVDAACRTDRSIMHDGDVPGSLAMPRPHQPRQLQPPRLQSQPLASRAPESLRPASPLLEIEHVELRGGPRRAAQQLRKCQSRWRRQVLLAIDGFEQLSIARRMWICWLAVWGRLPLLVTSHRPTWLPTLIHTEASVELAMELIRRAGERAGVAMPAELCQPQRITALLQYEQGNLREVFMRLYDEYQQRELA